MLPEVPLSSASPLAGAGAWPSVGLAPISRVLVVGGNRCGHQPAAPRFHQIHLPTDANPARPALITKAISQLRHYYQTPRQACWDDLSQGERHHRLSRQLDAAGGPNTATGQIVRAKLACWRQQRSERRESLIAVLSLMLYYTDILSLKVAIPRGPDWLGLSAPWIAQQTSLSLSRVKRALATLARCTLLINTGRGRQFDRRRRCWVGTGWGPVRQFSFRFIQALGLAVSWQQAQRKARKSQSLAKASGQMTAQIPATQPPLPILTAHAQQAHAKALRQQIKPPATPTTPTDIEKSRRLAALAAQGLSLTEIRQRLDEAAQSP